MSLPDRIHNSIHRRRDEDTSFPQMPSSLAPENPQPPIVHTAVPYTQPYLGLRARLSQMWLNRWTVLLILVLVRMILVVRSMEDDLGHAKTEALSACIGVESMGSAIASMPHYMAYGVNEAAARGIEHAVSGLEKVLLLSVTAVRSEE